MAMVRVLWRDAYYESEGDGSSYTDYLVCTLGHLIAEGPTFVTLASERLPDGTYKAITHVPSELVIELAHLTEGSSDE